MAGTAARWAAWERRGRRRATAGPLGGTDPETGTFSPRVEMYIGGAWVDITRTSASEAGVYYRDRITITRGRSDETTTPDPATCSFTLNNRDGRFSPRNPLSPYYGLIGRNTRVRVSVMRNGIRRYRFYGEVSAWPVKWDISGRDVYVPMQASGIKRRLQQGNVPTKSAVYRDMTSPTRTAIVAYWPFEDDTNATTVASGLPDADALAVASGAADFASYSDWFGSDPLPLLQTATMRGKIPTYTPTGQTSIRFFVKVNTAPDTTYQELVRWTSTGSLIAGWLSLKSNGNLRLICQDSTGTNQLDTGDLGFTMLTEPMATLTIELSEVSGGVHWRILATDIDNNASIHDSVITGELSGSVSGQTVGRITDIVVAGNGGLGEVAFGQLTIADDLNAYANSLSPLIAWNDEAPVNRVSRLCREEGISSSTVTGTGVDGTSMGSQHPDTLINLLEACSTTDLGPLYESREAVDLRMRTRLSLYNQDPKLTLSCADHELADGLDGLDDDQLIRNDVTITRTDGSSSRVIQETGPMSVADPPDGVGLYDDEITLSLGSDAQNRDQAAWRVHLGTVNEARYPQISLQLAHPAFTGDVDQMNGALTMDIGDRIVITDPPAWLPPDDISLLVQGYSETFDQFLYEMVINCSAESPYRIGVVGDSVLGRVDTAGSVLAADSGAGQVAFVGSAAVLNASAGTSVTVSVPAGTLSGHVMIARVGLIGQVTITAPAGWTPIGTPQDAGGSTRYAAYYRVADSEPSSYTWTLASGFKASGVITTYSSVDTSDPILDFEPTGTGTAGSSFTTAAVTAVDGALLDVGVFERHPATGSATGWTDAADVEQYDNGSASATGQDCSHAVYTSPVLSAGGITRTLTASQTVAQVATWAILLRPASVLSVATTSGPVWTTSPADFPFDIRFGGEVATVTNITGASSPQTFTVVRSVNGVSKAHLAGTVVELAQKMIIRL